MSKITETILPQGFEFVRDRIAEILIDEIDGQLLLTGDYDLDLEVFVERSIAFGESELPVINVCLDAGSWGNKHQGSSLGTYIFNIDVVTSAKTTAGQRGDKSAALKGQRIAGVVRSILEDPIYKTLGFVPPFISRTFCNDMKVGSANLPDANNQVITRVAFHVLVNETNKLIVPRMIEGYETTVKIDNTNKGYFYEGENY